MMFKKIYNMKELQKEKGLYYPYIMQLLGAPVIKGHLLCLTNIPYLYNNQIEQIFNTLIGIYIPNKNDKHDYSNKMFKKISISEFKDSVIWAIADLFYGGCDPDDFNEEEVFGFFDKEIKIRINSTYPYEYATKKKYEDILIA